MIEFRQVLCALLLTVFCGVAVAQNNTNSPYTRYGYGELANPNFGNSRAMGGIAFGLRDGAHINPLNPASYTAIDSLTFLFDGGITLQNSNVSSGLVKLNAKNSSFDYIAMQFRLRKGLAMSVGMLPFSNVGYAVVQATAASQGIPAHAKSFVGEGGLHQLYLGVGTNVTKNLSVGVNASYFWGDITRNMAMVFTDANSPANSYYETLAMSVADYKLDFGAQYTHDFDKKHAMTLGVVFSPKHNLNNDVTFQTSELATGGTNLTITSTKDSIATSGIPNTFGVGLTYVYDKRLTLGVDYSLQKWASVTYMDQRNAFCDRSKISLGAEYLPSYIARSYLSHVKYRLGAYYTTPYYKIGGQRASREYGVTAGFGLPVPRSRSILSLSAQYVRVEGLQSNILNENIFRVSIGLTFNERWFFKRKVD